MATISFIYNGDIIKIQSKFNEKMKDICNKFAIKNTVDINKIQFLYDGNQINFELTLNEQANSLDKQRKEMSVLVYDNATIITDNSLIKSNEIICPKCFENCRIKFKDYRIQLYGCKNGHEMKNILLNEFNNLQYINEANIICDICKNLNKSNAHNKQFFKCLTCNNNICPLCKSIHNKSHNIIDFNKKNYICNIHNDLFISYCNVCNVNLCYSCEEEHKNHNIIVYRDIFSNLNDIQKELNKFEKTIDNFKNIINDFINILNEVKENIDKFYKINYDIIKTFRIQDKNYQILQNINEVKNNIKMNDIEKIIKENNINKFKYILNLYNKMKNNIILGSNEIIARYKLNENEKKIRIFGHNFVLNNKNNCSILYKNETYELTEYFDISNFEEIQDTIEIKLKGINNITNMSDMFNDCRNLIELPDIYMWNTINVTNMSFLFKNCSSLLTPPEISGWETENVTDMSYMFSGCSSLISLPDISKWNISNVTDIRAIFSNCFSLEYLPDLSNLNTMNVTKMSYLFSECWKISSLPDISKWNTINVEDMNSMFYECESLLFLPDIGKWNITNLKNKDLMFKGCKNTLNIPKKFKN